MNNNNYFLLRQRFLKNIQKNWLMNNNSLKEISCVYSIVSIDYDKKIMDIFYIGSTTKLYSRYRSHKIPNNGFYDYEIKLIKKLQPLYNKQHK